MDDEPQDQSALRFFSDWKREVNKHLDEALEAMKARLPQAPYRHWFERGLTAREAASFALKQFGWTVPEDDQ